MNRPLRRLGFLVGVIFLIALGVLWMGRSRRPTALVKYKAELRAKGEKLSATELGYPKPPEISPGLERLQAAADRASKLRFQPWSLDLMPFSGAGEARVVWALPEPVFHSSAGVTNRSDTWKAIATQFADESDITTELREAVRFPPRYFFNDPTNFLTGRISPLVAMRTSAQWLGGDAMVALRAHELDRTALDIRALTRLAQFQYEDHTLVNQMIRVAVAALGLSVTWQALQAEGWDEEQLAGMQQDWEAVNLADAFETGMLGERAFGESAFAMIQPASSREKLQYSRGNFAPGPMSLNSMKDYFEAFILVPFWTANLEGDELFFLQHHQQNLDAIRKLKSGVAWPAVQAELQENVTTMDKAFGSPLGRYRYVFSSMAIPNSLKAAGNCVRYETQRRLTVAAIALERYRLRVGHHPPNLEALVPEFLSAVPMDLLGAKPLGYRLNADGSFTLYSAGEDGRDDGGDATPPSATSRFDLWSGRDAVWPVARDARTKR